MTSRIYAEVIGDPIAHSKSPLIHGFWLKKLSIDGEYRAMRVAGDGLGDYLSRRRGDARWRGCNVTMPLKLEALRAADLADEQATRVGAANLLTASGHELLASNTDVAGVLDALSAERMGPSATVAVFGTGGAARAALAAMRVRGVYSAMLFARDLAAGAPLLRDFGLVGSVRPFTDAPDLHSADVIINATSLGMQGKQEMPAAVLDSLRDALDGATVFDMVYDPTDTPLLMAARATGLRTVDGLHMLVGQAAAAFEAFFGQPAPRQHDPELRALLLA